MYTDYSQYAIAPYPYPYSFRQEVKRTTLAWHETLELHELIAFQTNGLMCFKRQYENVKDRELRNLYVKAIRALESNLTALLNVYGVPSQHFEQRQLTPAFYSGNLLGFLKTAVRNYAIAITETATPKIRRLLSRQLNNAIELHGEVFQYMNRKGYYPAYDLPKLVQNDINNATKAISMKH